MSVVLHHRREFQAVLKNYQPSPEAYEILRRIPLVIMLGVTGSGRNTIINHLVGSDTYHFVVSDTTRPPKLRDGAMEQDGVQYHFRTEKEVLADLQNGLYLEAELIHNQQVSGMSIRELEQTATSGKIPVNEIDIGGTLSVRAAKPDTIFFFIIPPSFKEWLYRLRGREVMSEQELRNRLETAVKVIDEALSRNDFVFIVNESSHRSAEEIDAYVHEQTVMGDQEFARTTTVEIRAELVEFLKSPLDTRTP
jgi:guanylate kinase